MPVTGSAQDVTSVIDGHVHFWDPDRLRYPWLDDQPALRRPLTPSDLDTGGLEVAGFVFVQAETVPDQAAAEVEWVRALAAAGAPVLGVVARAALEDGADGPELASYAADPLVVGVRRLIHDEPPGFAVRSAFVDAVRALPGHGLTFDLCVRHHQVDEACRLVELCPDVTFVLDHLGKPEVAPSGPAASWSDEIARLATRPNVWCKLSGLATEARPADRTPEVLLPYLAFALDTFGPDRCLFGSDWPVSGQVVDYRAWYDVVGLACERLTTEDRAKVFAENAVDVYGLDRRKEDDAWHSPTRRSSASRP
jgi:predicted TIM-barrel fold metal-dependent hydrolase